MCNCPYKYSRWCEIRFFPNADYLESILKRTCPITRSDNLKAELEELVLRIPELEKLSEKLQEISPDSKTIISCLEYNSKEILTRGQLFSLKGAKFSKGTPHECHRNSGKLYLKDPKAYRICIGYALSNYEWFQHTWLIENRSSILVEPTSKFQMYFGFKMTVEESDAFCRELKISS